MAVSEDLINFDIIETQKENIQSLPQGRSAKALASAFGATPFSPVATPGSTRNLNDAIRSEYEKEIQNIRDSDDPLDVYDRYVKWTMNAYPTTQATPESQLRSLLERATKAFQSVNDYKNDPRYLKLWMHYIRLFSDAPREIFAYLSRHGIGEGLALYYEEFAAWLEGVGRWNQAEEVYKMGIEREARPTERLLRKFGEFQTRYAQRPQITDEPSSPALPTVRPALAAKIDPFASSATRPADPQAQRLPSAATASRSGKPKLAIFADADAPSAAFRPANEDAAKGWDNIGTIAERKKENTVEARPWVGETLKTGKRAGAGTKLMVFKDESNAQVEAPSVHQRTTTNAKTGRVECVFANLQAVYPNPNDLTEEYSFEELRARHRGLLEKRWTREHVASIASQASEDSIACVDSQDMTQDFTMGDFTTDLTVGGTKKPRKDRSRPRRKKVMEVKGETQTIKTNLDSPTGRKVKRKNSTEPTMTLHTKAANEEMLDIFNQPLGQVKALGKEPESGDESEYDSDDYTSGGESTGTGHISASEYGDDDPSVHSIHGIAPDSTEPQSVSEWSEFTKSKHIPALQSDDSKGSQDDTQADFHTGLESIPESSEDKSGLVEGGESVIDELVILEAEAQVVAEIPSEFEEDEEFDFIAPGLESEGHGHYATGSAPTLPLSIPLPPEDLHIPTNPYRDPEQVAQSRLPFMTPIVERTECSFPSIKADNTYYSAKTPSRRRNGEHALPNLEDLLLSSPFQELVNDERPARARFVAGKDVPEEPELPLIKDKLCSPLDPSIRSTILEAAQPFLVSLNNYHDHRPARLNKGAELRKFSKSMKSLKPGEKTPPGYPCLVFPGPTKCTVTRELGKGGFAPVYLASVEDNSQEGAHSVALKAEEPASAWEFYLMTVAHQRLGAHRASASLAQALALELFVDEGYLLESYHDQGTILDLSNLSKAEAAATGGMGLIDEAVAMFFAVELLRTMSALHEEGILHGDIKADNCLVRLPSVHDTEWSARYMVNGMEGWSVKGLTLIDFGRSLDRRNFRNDAAFLADWPPDKHDCPAVRSARPWTVQPDYWGAAGVIHLLLFGKWLEDIEMDANASETVTSGESTASPCDLGDGAADAVASNADPSSIADASLLPSPALPISRRYRPRDAFKRYWQTDLWTAVFEVLLNPPAAEEGRAVRLAQVVGDLEGWLEANSEKRGLRGGLRRIEDRIRMQKRRG